MNRTALPAALALVLAGSLAFAQQPQPQTPDATPPAAAPARTPNPHRQAIKLSQELSLTPDQTAKLEPILADRDQKIAALRTNTSIAPADFKKQMHAIQKSTRDRLDTVLTLRQTEQLKTLRGNGGRGLNQPLSPPPAA